MTDQETAPREAQEPPSSSNGEDPLPSLGRQVARWIVVALAVVFFGFLMREVLFPFRGQPYMEISHGDHIHYVPKDRNETVPVSSFPMSPPEEGERITPDGDIVPKE
jgi:hypothetical protein